MHTCTRHTAHDTRADFFFGMYQLETRFARIKPTGVLNNNVVQDQKACKHIRAEEEQTTAARTKHEDEEEDTGTRPAGKER